LLIKGCEKISIPKDCLIALVELFVREKEIQCSNLDKITDIIQNEAKVKPEIKIILKN